MRRFRLAFAGLAVLLGAAAIAGCGGSSPSGTSATSVPTAAGHASGPVTHVSASQTAAPPELSHLTVGVLPAVTTATLYLAIKQGYFQQEGLTVTPRTVTVSADAIPFLLHGTIAISSGNLDTYLAADASGVLPLRILNETAICSPGTLAVLAGARSRITSAAGLAGKTIAVAGDPNIQTLTINRLLGAEAKSVHYVVVPFPDMAAALAAGQVDAMATLEPYISAAEHAAHAKVVLDQCGGANAGIPLGGYFTTASWAAKYPDTARAFQAAINKAQALANSDPALIRQVLPTFMKVSAAVAAKVGLPRFATGLNVGAIQAVADLAFAGGELKSKVDAASLSLLTASAYVRPRPSGRPGRRPGPRTQAATSTPAPGRAAPSQGQRKTAPPPHGRAGRASPRTWCQAPPRPSPSAGRCHWPDA